MCFIVTFCSWISGNNDHYHSKKTYFGISFSRFQLENLVTPGVEMIPLYLDWFGLAKGNPIPAELPRRPPAPIEGVVRFLMVYLEDNVCLLVRYP